MSEQPLNWTELQEKIQALENTLKQKEKEIYSIQRIGKALSSTLKLDELLNLIMQEITVLMDADRSTLYLLDRERGEIWSKIALKAEVKEIRQKLGKGISGYVAQTGEVINIPDAYNDTRFDPTTDKKTGYRTRSILCMPVWEPLSPEKNREVMGVVQVLNKRSGVFTKADEALLETLSAQVAVSIANSRLYHQLENKYQEIDLLHEFEQLLSSVYQLPELVEKILSRTLMHLQAECLLTCFPLHKQFIHASTRRKQNFIYETLTTDSPQWLQFVQNPTIQGLQENVQFLKDRIRVSTDRSLVEGTALFSPIEMANGQQGILLALGLERGEKVHLEDERKLLDLVAQKISRAVELHNLRESLLRQERLSAIGQMLSTIVHDIRGPINTVYGFVDLMKDESTAAAERADYAEVIYLEIQTMLNMVTEVLDFARGKTSILPRKTGVTNVVKRFTPQLEQMCQRSNVKYEIEVQSQNLIYVDENKLVRVFYNITKNALEAMGRGGKFYFGVKDEGKDVVFQFTDNGPGIPEKVREHLFDSFVTSGKESGTGLGLAIVKKIVEEHRGTIEVESEEGKGATFRIRLPIYSKS